MSLAISWSSVARTLERPDYASQVNVPGAAMRSRLGPRPRRVSTKTLPENHVCSLRVPQPQELLVIEWRILVEHVAETLLTQLSRERLEFRVLS